jgi:hypothetical protein
MSFDEIELPLRVGFGSTGGPSFSIVIVVIDSGYEWSANELVILIVLLI